MDPKNLLIVGTECFKITASDEVRRARRLNRVMIPSVNCFLVYNSARIKVSG